MIVVDTSAIVAIANYEPEAIAFRAVISRSSTVVMSVGNLLELHLVTTKIRARFDIPALLTLLAVRAEPVTVRQLGEARRAHDRFGRGSMHKADLNYGDCFAYSLAKMLGAPLLYKGNDFAQTDIEAVPY